MHVVVPNKPINTRCIIILHCTFQSHCQVCGKTKAIYFINKVTHNLHQYLVGHITDLTQGWISLGKYSEIPGNNGKYWENTRKYW